MIIKKTIFILIVLSIITVAIFTLFYAYKNEEALEEKSREINREIDTKQEQLNNDARKQMLNILEELDRQVASSSLSREKTLDILENLDIQTNDDTDTKEEILRKLEELDKQDSSGL